jgi:hypothetical protein
MYGIMLGIKWNRLKYSVHCAIANTALLHNMRIYHDTISGLKCVKLLLPPGLY